MSDIIGTIIVTLLWVFGFGIIGLLGFIVHNNSKYKIDVIVKEVNNGTKLTAFDKAKEIQVDGDATWWYLKKAKTKIPPPPSQCVEISPKGKKVVQLYKIDGGEYVPAKDGFDFSDKDKTEKLLSKIQPFTASQRQMLVSQQRKSLANVKQTMGEILAKAMPYMAMTMIIVCFLLFFGEAVQPSIDAGDKFVQVSNNLIKVTNHLDQIINDKMVISDIEDSTPQPPMNVTPPN